MSKKETTINQHFVPRTYLYKFGPKGLLDRCYINSFKYEREKSIKKHLCCEDWFYETLTYIKNEDVYKKIENFIEDKLGKIEIKYNRFYKNLMNSIKIANATNGIVSLSKEDLIFMKEFIVLQAVRTKKAFDIIDKSLRIYLSDIDSIDSDLYKFIQTIMLFPKSIHNDKNIKESLYDIFINALNSNDKAVVFLTPTNKEDRFFVSDSPATIIIYNEYIGCNDFDFLFPICEKYAVFIYNTKTFPQVIPNTIIKQDEKNMADWNRIIIENANEYVMSLNFTKKERDFIENIV